MEQRWIIIQRVNRKSDRWRRFADGAARHAPSQAKPLRVKNAERVSDGSPRLTDEDYRKGRLMGAVILMLDNLERAESADTHSLQELAAEAALWL